MASTLSGLPKPTQPNIPPPPENGAALKVRKPRTNTVLLATTVIPPVLQTTVIPAVDQVETVNPNVNQVTGMITMEQATGILTIEQVTVIPIVGQATVLHQVGTPTVTHTVGLLNLPHLTVMHTVGLQKLFHLPPLPLVLVTSIRKVITQKKTITIVGAIQIMNECVVNSILLTKRAGF